MARTTVELYLIRHAHAGDPARWSGPDEDRPLSEKGRRQAERLGNHLASLQFTADAIISSPKVRARQTADLVAAAIGGQVRIDERVGGGLTTDLLDDVLADAGHPSRAVVVGHDPDFSELLSELSGAASIPMRKGALARLDAARPLRQGAAILRWLIPPDALGEGRA